MNITRQVYNQTLEAIKKAAFEDGIKEGFRRRDNERLTARENAELDALKNICQAGSSVIEGMTKALLSFNKNL